MIVVIRSAVQVWVAPLIINRTINKVDFFFNVTLVIEFQVQSCLVNSRWQDETICITIVSLLRSRILLSGELFVYSRNFLFRPHIVWGKFSYYPRNFLVHARIFSDFVRSLRTALVTFWCTPFSDLRTFRNTLVTFCFGLVLSGPI